MGFQTAAGSALAISAGTPATQDAAGYAALTYTEIGNIDKIGGIGATFAKVEFQPLKGGKKKFKGSPDYGTLNPTMALDGTDAGQTLLATAAADETQKFYAFKVTMQDGTFRYFQGIVFGMPETIDSADTVVTAAPMIELVTKPIKAPAS